MAEARSLPALSARLRAVLGAIGPSAPLADVGTDHAGVPIHAVHGGRVPRAIAIDVKSGPLEVARRAIEASGLTDIELRPGNGLDPLEAGEAATIVLAGMGGPLIRRLVDARSDIVAATDRLILQPNTQWTQTRRWLADHAWTLCDEVLVEDAGKFYVLLVVQPHRTAAPTWDEADFVLGPHLRRRPDPTFERYRLTLRNKTERDLAKLTAHRPPDDPRRAELQALLDLLSSTAPNRS